MTPVRMRRLRLSSTLLLAVFLASCIVIMALAAPPPGADGRYRDWFRSLKDASGISCCDVSDCLPTSARVSGEGYQAKTPAGDWVTVPADKVIRRDNPLGVPVMCWLPHRGVMCFVPGIEA